MHPEIVAMLGTDPLPMFICGAWASNSSDAPIPIYDPANGEELCKVVSSDLPMLDSAINASFAAFNDGCWSGLTPEERSRGLAVWAELVDRDSDLLAELETLQTGKPIYESRGDVSRALDGIRFYSAAARNIRGEVITVSREHHSYIERSPVGVVAAIVPWNVPIVLTISKSAPALAAGNTVIVKPSQTTPLTALHLAKLWQEAGLPQGVFSVVNGPGRTIGEALCLDPRVTAITFTGSTEVGLRLSELAAKQNKRIMLELGGKSPNIVLADADLSRAIPGAAQAIFYGQGQICAAGSRLLIEEPVFDDVVAGVVAHANSLRIGDPLDPETQFGCLTSRPHRDEVRAWIDRAVADGARIVTDQSPITVPGLPEGAFMRPTVLLDAKVTDAVSCEEVFGPVLVVHKVRDAEHAIELANDSEFGLSAGVWSRDTPKARSVASSLQAGVVWINDYGKFNPAMPFGGVKLSGSAHREWSHLAMDAYLESKSIWEWNR